MFVNLLTNVDLWQIYNENISSDDLYFDLDEHNLYLSDASYSDYYYYYYWTNYAPNTTVYMNEEWIATIATDEYAGTDEEKLDLWIVMCLYGNGNYVMKNYPSQDPDWRVHCNDTFV